MIRNMSGAIQATHISSDKFNLISSEHTMSDQLTIKASPHHRGVVTVQHTMPEPEPERVIVWK